jgi:hypothetical protein
MAETNILESVKAYCRITLDSGVTAYDDELISHINTVLMMLNQMGVGPDGGFALVDGTETWSQVVPDNVKYPGIIDYIKIKTRILFDPEAFTPNAMQSAEKVLEEIEWRLNYKADAERAGILS